MFIKNLGNLNGFDIAMGIVIFLLMIRCARRGFIGEVFSVGSWALGILGAMLFCPRGAEWIRANIFSLRDIRVLPEIIAFAVLFAVIASVVKFLGWMLMNAAEVLRLGALDKTLGAALGIIEGLALTGGVIVALRFQPLFDASAFIEGSFFGRLFLQLISSLPGTTAMGGLFTGRNRYV